VAPPVLHLLVVQPPANFLPMSVPTRNGLGEAHNDLVDYSSALFVIVSLFSNAAPALADCGTSA